MEGAKLMDAQRERFRCGQKGHPEGNMPSLGEMAYFRTLKF
jgi:hypothetical protein